MKFQNRIVFLRIYISLLAALSIVNIFLPVVTGMSFLKSLFLISLLCVPVTIALIFILNSFSDAVINGFYGLRNKQDNTAGIRDSEIVKLIPLKEKEEYRKVLSGLEAIEKQYGTSSRIIYERAECLMKLGELRKARKCIKDFLSVTQSDENDPYRQFIKQLVTHDHSPLSLKEIDNVRNQ